MDWGLRGVAGTPAWGVGAYWRGLSRQMATARGRHDGSIRPAGAAISLCSIRRANSAAGGDAPLHKKAIRVILTMVAKKTLFIMER